MGFHQEITRFYFHVWSLRMLETISMWDLKYNFEQSRIDGLSFDLGTWVLPNDFWKDLICIDLSNV